MLFVLFLLLVYFCSVFGFIEDCELSLIFDEWRVVLWTWVPVVLSISAAGLLAEAREAGEA